MLVSALEGHKLWSSSYDSEPNPLVALNQRILSERLGSIAGLCVIDIGCGTGNWIQYAQAQSAKCIGLDTCYEMLLQAAFKTSVRGRVSNADAVFLPVRNEAADVVVCSLCLSYLRDPQPAFEEMSRITRRGGRIVISDLHPDAAKAGWKRGFRAGNHEYELMHTMHSADLIHRCGRSANLLQSWELSARFDTPERLIFAAAGKEQVFENARRIHALRMTEWRKR